MHLQRNEKGELELLEEKPYVIERKHWNSVYVPLDHIDKVIRENDSLCLDDDDDVFSLLQKIAEGGNEM